ncbi:MAG: DUF3888 domain-containing protein [Oscillospiraceae bacterium]|nr:DUF3888 domain-containing protein [Oscillospiraceae bacterium]
MKKILILVIMAFIFLNFTISAKTSIEKKDSREKIYTDIIFTFLRSTIDKAIDDYYHDVAWSTPGYGGADYTNILRIERINEPNQYRPQRFIVEIEVEPYIGPHITVGKDRIIMEIDPDAEVHLIKFEHLESYEMPEHYDGFYLDPPIIKEKDSN